mgnify:FL=1
MPEDSSPITPPPAPPFVPGITDPKYTQVVDEAQRAAVEAARQAANVQTVDAGRAQAKLLTGISKKYDLELEMAALRNAKQIESGGEYGMDRDETVLNAKGGTITLDNTTGSEAVRISQKGGGNVKITDTVNSEFAPNNKQTLVNGDKFSTTKGDYFNQIQSNKEDRTFGDHTISVGDPNFYTTSLAQDWLDTFQDIAIAKTNPELNYGGVGVNTEIAFPVDGTPSESGAVEGGTYTKNKAQEFIQDIIEEAAPKLAKIEKDMGVGGNLKLFTTKNFVLRAGAGTASTDPGIMVANARPVTKKYKVEDGKAVEETQPVSVYESKDTANGIPFGDVHISAGTKIRMNAGAGGVGITSAGDVSIASTGRYTIGGAEVAIGGSTIGDSGRVTIVSDTDVFVDSGQLITHNAPYINNIAKEQITHVTPCAVFTGDLHVTGDLRVEGNIISCGFYGIRAKGDIVAGGGAVSLLNHRHGGVEQGDFNTCKPNRGSGQN